MIEKNLEGYRAILEAKMAELNHSTSRDEIRAESNPDPLDDSQMAVIRELALRNFDHDTNLLRNVRAALDRIDNGSYGTCLHCEEKIKPKRLDAVPWTPFCIRCQEAADKDELGIETAA